MTLRTKLSIYLVVIHLPAAIVAGFLFRDPQQRIWLLVFELVVAASLLVGARLIRATLQPAELLQDGTDLIAEGEFAVRFRHVGHADLDRLIDLYNTMLDRLREERLRVEEQHTLLQKILSISPTGVVMLDFDGRVEQMNPSAERLLRRSLSDARGLAPEDAGGSLGRLGEVPPGAAQMISLESRRRLRVWRGEFLDRGFVRHFFLVEELTEELRSTEKVAYEKVIRMLSHEINNSVAAVSSLLESMLQRVDSFGEQRESFERAIDISASRLRSLDAFTRDFAEVVRIPKPVLDVVDLSRLTREIVDLHRPDVQSRRIRIEASLPEGESLIRGDKNQLEQVVVNVVRNAIEATPEGGVITASIVDGEDVTLSIRDSGSGLTPEASANLFTPFYSSKRNGRGLGLTIVQEILANHDAAFSLRNHPAGGAEFVMTFAPTGLMRHEQGPNMSPGRGRRAHPGIENRR